MEHNVSAIRTKKTSRIVLLACSAAALLLLACAVYVWKAGAGVAASTPTAEVAVTSPVSGVSRPAPRARQPSIDGPGFSEAGPPSPADLDARRNEELFRLDRQFRAEQVDPGWAAASEAVVAAQLAKAHLVEQGAPDPVHHEVECRSSACRIEIVYAGEMESQIGLAFLTGDIGVRLPTATTISFPQPDGSVRFVIFATTGRTPSAG